VSDLRCEIDSGYRVERHNDGPHVLCRDATERDVERPVYPLDLRAANLGIDFDAAFIAPLVTALQLKRPAEERWKLSEIHSEIVERIRSCISRQGEAGVPSSG
jgi:hypothetical protein